MESHRRSFYRTSRPARWVALLAAVLPTASRGASDESAWTPQQIGFSRAVDVLRSGGDHAYAIKMLDRIARQGDARAQVLLASLYIEGKELPADPVLAQAWLQVATSGQSYFVEDTLHWAQDLLLSNSTRLTGPQLIAAEALSSKMILERTQSLDNGIREALKARYTTVEPTLANGRVLFNDKISVSVPETAGESPMFKPGYAITEARDGSARAADQNAARACTGEIEPYDQPPTIAVDGNGQAGPTYPTSARRLGVEGRAVVLIHIGRTGKVCGASIAYSTGSPLLDAAAIDDMRRRQFTPALHGGQPTESFVTFGMTFRIAGYKFRP